MRGVLCALESFYRTWVVAHGKPFVFGEWALPFRLSRYPRASGALRQMLKSSEFSGRVREYPPLRRRE